MSGQGLWPSGLGEEGEAETEKAWGLAGSTVRGLGAGVEDHVGGAGREVLGSPHLPHICLGADLSLIH